MSNVIPLNTLQGLYALNDIGVPCHIHTVSKKATQPIVSRFGNCTCADDYIRAGVKYIVPMTAKEIESREEQERLLADPEYYVEEKFDGTRGIMHFYKTKTLSDFKALYPDWENNAQHNLYICLLNGSGFENGMRRIYDYFITHTKVTDKANFVKSEYGIGGCAGGDVNYSTDSSGFTLNPSSEQTCTYTWKEVVEAVQFLIDEGFYYPQEAYTRVFSRRESKKTGWLTENTDSVPQLRDLNVPELAGTVIDGEMFIPNQPFKAVASTLNCKYDKAIARQIELGGIVFHAFDILYFKGIDLRHMPLYRRKVYLDIVCQTVNSRFIKNVRYYDTDGIPVAPLTMSKRDEVLENDALYPNLAKDVKKHINRLKSFKDNDALNTMLVSKKAYYEYIVFTGGEGVIIKPKYGKYYHKRGREYQKIKKFLTRECIICGFTEPTKEYTGKFPKDCWDYWIDPVSEKRLDVGTCHVTSALALRNQGYTPVTKHYFENLIGNIEYGVVITDDEVDKLPKNKKHDIRDLAVRTDFNDYLFLKVLIVGECSGFDEEERAILTKHREALVGAVVEIKANEIFRDTGKLRHPRFLRLRPDKSPLHCTFKEHIL